MFRQELGGTVESIPRREGAVESEDQKVENIVLAAFASVVSIWKQDAYECEAPKGKFLQNSI